MEELFYRPSQRVSTNRATQVLPGHSCALVSCSLLQCPFDEKKDALVTKHLSQSQNKN